MERLSAERVSSTCPSLGEGVAALEPRRLGGLELPCLFLDATYVKCRRDRRARSTAVATATACGSDGARRVVGFGATDAEAYPGWPGFCRDLRRRGLSGVRCAASGAHEGLRRAIGERLPGAARQRCTVHLERNVCSPPKTKRRGAVAGKVPKAVLREGDPAVVREACHAAVDATSRMSRAASELLEGAGSDALAYPDLPREHRRRMRTSNVQERANGEMKRRSRVVQVLPSTPPMARLIGAVMAEEDEDWPSRRWIVPESLARPDEPRAPEPVATEAAKGRATKIVRSATELSGPSKEAA